jgi:hypothetical protein
MRVHVTRGGVAGLVAAYGLSRSRAKARLFAGCPRLPVASSGHALGLVVTNRPFS